MSVSPLPSHGFRRWAERRADELADDAAAGAVAVVPVAAVEQHGPHLPLGTDLFIAEGMLRTLEALAPPEADVLALPVQAVGKSDEHLYAAGTLTLPPGALVECWTALGHAVARAGIRRIVFVSSHGGNEEVLGIVARNLRVEHGMRALRSSWGRFGTPDDLIDERERLVGIHGGEIETSLMLHFRPDLVRMDRAADFRSSYVDDEERFDLLRPTGPFGYAWIASDLNPAGVVGNAARATADTGRRIAEHQVRGLAKLLGDLAKVPTFGAG